MATGNDTRIAIVGGGLVGSLAACYLGRRGFKVDLYEYRDDIRLMEHVSGRSINLALSERGIQALRKIGLEHEVIKEHGIPMYGRMIHGRNGKMSPIPYGKQGQFICSISRRYLNEVLLTAADKNENVNIYFRHKLVNANLDTGELEFLCNDGDLTNEKGSDLIIGADGAFSTVRREMIKRPLFDYSQHYIDHGYIELSIPPTMDGNFAMPENYLHIWPRDEFMLIALPNQDRSWTVTLFLQFEQFAKLSNEEELLSFFGKYFPDAIHLIGKEKLVHDFFNTTPSHLMSVKCNPYHVGQRALLIGDAAHAMVPFYGQGMNAGFEDCIILDDLVEKHSGNFGTILPEFSSFRNPDAETICDLALQNYVEMRHLVNTKAFIMRKKLDGLLNSLFPKKWIPLYSMVTFSRIRYSQCVANRKWQDKIIYRSIATSSIIALCLGGWTAYRKAQAIDNLIYKIIISAMEKGWLVRK